MRESRSYGKNYDDLNHLAMSVDFLMPLYSWIKLSTLAFVSNFVTNLIQLEAIPCYVLCIYCNHVHHFVYYELQDEVS